MMVKTFHSNNTYNLFNIFNTTLKVWGKKSTEGETRKKETNVETLSYNWKLTTSDILYPVIS